MIDQQNASVAIHLSLPYGRRQAEWWKCWLPRTGAPRDEQALPFTKGHWTRPDATKSARWTSTLSRSFQFWKQASKWSTTERGESSPGLSLRLTQLQESPAWLYSSGKGHSKCCRHSTTDREEALSLKYKLTWFIDLFIFVCVFVYWFWQVEVTFAKFTNFQQTSRSHCGVNLQRVVWHCQNL